MQETEKSKQLLLKELRDEIIETDQSIIELLGKRMHIVEQIGELKSVHQMQIQQDGFWEESCKLRQHIATEKLVSVQLVSEIFEYIHNYSIQVQEKYITKKNDTI